MWKYLEFKYLTNAKVIFLLGNDAIRQWFGFNFPSVLNIHGDIYRGEYQGRTLYIVPLCHPGFLLRNPAFRKDTAVILKYVKENLIEKLEKGDI